MVFSGAMGGVMECYGVMVGFYGDASDFIGIYGGSHYI